MNHQSRIAVVSEIADLQVMLAQTQSRMARLMQKVSEWDVPAPQVAASPEPLLAIPRAQDIQGSDQGGESGALRRFGHEPRSEQKTTSEAQGRNEPASAEAVAGATAGEGDEGSEPPPAPRDEKKPVADAREASHELANRDQRIIARLQLGERVKAIAADMGISEAIVRTFVPKPRIMSTEEVRAKLASEVAAKATKPAPAPYSEPMEPTEAIPIPAAELPAPIPAIAVADDTVMIVANGVVHGPGGIEERLGPKEIKILARMADGGMYPADVLAEIAGAKNGAFTYLMNGMRGKLAGVGVEIYQPIKGMWRARRAGE